ncbi:MAG: hypothetical protein M3542_06995 [Acidobacteriota bacterium]|nr:hypothetical protein [Acidobacteriota bacterium]MDQ5873306.1 hypothetical protein [Acidobacteriota bacterium]
MSRPDRGTLLPLAGSAVLAAFSIAALPFSRGLFHAPRTPYDASEAGFIAVRPWIVLQRAQSLVPPGASVVVRIEPGDPSTDSYLHRFAVALLPGRRIVPAALWSVPTDPAGLLTAEYIVVVGPVPSPAPPGVPLVQLPEGSIWKKP